MKTHPSAPVRSTGLLRRVLCGVFALASLMLGAGRASAQNNANADAVYNGWLNAYLIRSGGQTYFCNNLVDRSRAFMWGQAYMITAVEDAYDRSPTPANKQLVIDLLDTFLANETSNLSWDSWNDDVEWAVIALVRGYQITGKRAYLDAAAWNWDMTYNRGWDNTYGGGIWENMDNVPNGGKGGLSNWPQVIAGCMIYQSTGDVGYLNKCISIYNWTRTHCYDPATGRVYEDYIASGFHGDDNSYNSGLLVNAANSLYRITGNQMYYDDAVKAADHCIAKYNDTGGIMDEDHPANGGFGCDQLVRGVSKFARENNLWSKYYPFLQANCTASWNRRRTDHNVTANNFTVNTSTTQNWWAMEVEGSVVIQLVTQINPLVGMHYVVCRQNNKAMENARSSAQGSGIIQWAQNRTPQQMWNFTQNSDTSWNITSVYSAQALDNANSSANGTQVIQWAADSNNTNQRWWVDRQSDGSYKIWNKANSKSLDNSSSAVDGYKTVQWDWNGGIQQRWNLQ